MFLCPCCSIKGRSCSIDRIMVSYSLISCFHVSQRVPQCGNLRCFAGPYFSKCLVSFLDSLSRLLLRSAQGPGCHHAAEDVDLPLPGQVEVHTKDADILYVLKGTATVVTGGTMVDGKHIAPDEIRGREISGGETRQLVPGDAMIIPNNVPHWFKEVQGTFLYFVVKVR